MNRQRRERRALADGVGSWAKRRVNQGKGRRKKVHQYKGL